MKFALSTFNQGAYITLPAILNNTSGAAWIIGGTAIVHDLSANRNLIGASSSTQNVLRFYPDGSVAMRAGSIDRITASAGAAVVGDVFAWEIRNNTATGNWEFYFNDMNTPVGVFARGSTAWAMNQLCRFSTSPSPFFTILSFYASGGASYVDSWDDTTAVSTGTSWNSASGTRDLTIVGATGASDTWWTPYGGSTIVDTTFAVSAAASISLQAQKLQSSPIAIAVSGSIALMAAKLSPTTMAIAASVFFGLSYRKQCAQKVAVPGSGAVVLAANKGGVSTLSIPIAVEVGLYSGVVSNVEGTFTVSVSAAFSFQSSKAAASTTAFAAAAALAIAGNKSGQSNAVVNAAVTMATNSAKYSQAKLSVAVATSITINGQNLSAGEPEQWPVDVVFVSTNSRYQHAIASGSRFEYHITTHSRGGTSV
jgi:hypothetical protein